MRFLVKLLKTYTFHNLIGHPLAELAWLITGNIKVFWDIHDATLPPCEKGVGEEDTHRDE